MQPLNGISKTPADPDLFELNWANPLESKWIAAQLRHLGRQTMNIREMPEARLLVVKHAGKIVGWGGVSFKHAPEYPEMFSLYLAPKFRDRGLGKLIDAARCAYLLSQGFSVSYLRMTIDPNSNILSRRLSSGAYTPLSIAELPPAFPELCRKCELYGNTCSERIYLRVDLAAMLASAQSRITPEDLQVLPRFFRVSKLAHDAEIKFEWAA